MIGSILTQGYGGGSPITQGYVSALAAPLASLYGAPRVFIGAGRPGMVILTAPPRKIPSTAAVFGGKTYADFGQPDVVAVFGGKISAKFGPDA